MGDTVVVRDPGTKEIGGFFTVGLGSKDLAKQPERFAANNIDPGSKVEIIRTSVVDQLITLPTVFGVEANEEDHARRSEIIRRRFGKDGFGENSYIVVPTSVAKQISIPEHTVETSKPTMGAVSLCKVKIGDVVGTLPVVPVGSEFGLTSKAAEHLGIPAATGSKIEFYISDEGVLVINQVSSESE